MADFDRFEFTLPGYTPETMPFDRLLEYLEQLAAILGQTSDLHLVDIKKSSTKPVFLMPRHAAVKARKRARETWEGGGPQKARDAYRRIRRMVSEDGGKPAVLSAREGTVIEFPSVDLGADQEVGSLRQPTTVTGELIRIGGDAEDAQLLIKDMSGQVVAGCSADRDVAKRLAKHIYEPIRVSGIASWHRDRLGRWKITRMRVQTFETVDSDSLTDALLAVQSAIGEWPDNTLDTLLEMRRGEAA
jgi:hypothetical protein